MSNANTNSHLTLDMIRQMREAIESDPRTTVAINAATRGNVQELALNRDVINAANFTFSHEIETKAEISDQKRSGTCWMYAELNWMRTMTMEKFNAENIEFSHNHLVFWDKLEKANFFLENMIRLRDLPLDDRKVNFLLSNPLPDGGEWHMVVNLIKKYGLVPMEVMPDTFNRENSKFINEIVGYKVRECAVNMRKMHTSGESETAIRKFKTSVMEEIYRIMVILCGNPVQKFDWSYRDKDKNYHQEIQMTPHEFYEKYVGLDLDECYTLVNCPVYNAEMNKTYTIEFFNNMEGGIEWKWLNVPIEEMKEIAIKMLKDKQAVLYGCDVVQESHTKLGLMFDELYEYDLFFQTEFGMDKQTRLDYGESVLTHSMVLQGVELVEDKPIRWKVENSWGKDIGTKGFMIMSDKWFDEYTYDLIVPRKYMPKKLLDLFAQDPEQLPPWSPMA